MAVERLEVEGAPGGGDHIGDHALAPLVVGSTHHGDVDDVAELDQHLLNLA
ncbi:unannotated protein [freshwater metagenome]|uniref:Unannotated protein n=1 Tax=freshwater metagenome TaxID=449393 RepID=A0A6J7KQ48_9ZZZZ